MVIDKGITVYNYVGTYTIQKRDDTPVIVSNEYKPAKEGEPIVPIKQLFSYDARDWDYISFHLANVDIHKPQSILDFCNTYGLPYSSSKIDDIHPGYYFMGMPGLLPNMDKFWRQDHMDLSEFCRHVTTVKNILELKYQLERRTRDINSLLSPFLSLLLYDRRSLYDFEYDEDDVMPEYESLRFQYYFLSFTESKKSKWKNSSLENKVLQFIGNYYLHIQEPDKHPSEGQRKADYRCDEWLDLYNVLYNVFLTGHTTTNSVDEYGNVDITINKSFSSDIVELIYTQATRILCDTISQYLIKVHPTLKTNPECHISGEWVLDFQFDGIMMELFILLSKNDQYRKCHNPNCGNYFPALPTSKRKYCSDTCKFAVAKRKQRKLDAEIPNRPRQAAQFKDRKRKYNPK